MSKFKVGDKVILVNDSGLYPVNLVPGGIYTIDIISGEFVTLKNGVFSKGCYDYHVKLYEEKEKEMVLTNNMNAEQIRDEILRIDVRIEEANKDIEKAQEERNSLVEKLREKGFTLVGEISQADSNKPFLEIWAKYVVNGNKNVSTWFSPGTEVTLLEIDEDDILDAKVERDDWECDWMKSKGLTKI